jgi:hypothetical protein
LAAMLTHSRTLGAIVGLALLGTQASTAGVQQPTQQPTLTKEAGASAMRMMLTMQANKPYGPKTGYGSLSEILSLVPSVYDEATLIDEQTASYRGYTIRLTRSADQKRFELTMVPNGGVCAISWFSNEQNVIYSGQALGCPAQ